MFGSEALEVAIGLVFVFFIMSLLCSTVTEWISRVLALRAKTLKDGIYKLINNDKELNKTILGHPLFQGLSSKTKNKDNWWDLIGIGKWKIFKKRDDGPSELPPSTFSQIIFDTLMDAGKEPGSGYAKVVSSADRKSEQFDEKGKSKSLLKESYRVIETLEGNLESTSDKFPISDKNKQILKSLLAMAKTKVTSWDGAIAEFRTSLEKWFDDSMQRVTGWYKRKTQLIVLGLALVLCFALNVDSFGIANSLINNSALRETVVAAAEAHVEKAISENDTADLTYSELSEKLSGLNLPIGWTSEQADPNRIPETPWGWLLKIVGILVTAFAVSLGAGFWFDLLSKLVNLRAAGKTPKKTEEETAVKTG